MAETANYQILVTNPETRNGTLKNYTSYLVEGTTIDGVSFSARKRYSDFEWVREQLKNSFPGVLVPQLPDKSFQNRFDETFIEHRRARLQKFLEKLFEHSHFQNNSLLKGWLACPEYSMENFRKDRENRPIQEIAAEYKKTFADIIAQAEEKGIGSDAEELAKDTTRLARFVNAHYEVITLMGKKLEGIFGGRSAEQQSTEELVSTLENLGITEKYAQHELSSMQLPWRPRAEDAVKGILEARKAGNPHGGWEHLARAIRGESQDAKSLADAIMSIQALEAALAEREDSLARLNGQKQGVKLSSFFSSAKNLVSGKDQDPQIMRDKLTVEIAACTEFIVAARQVLSVLQGPHILKDMVVRYRALVLQLAEDRARTLREEATFWDQLVEQAREDGSAPPAGADMTTAVTLPSGLNGPRASELDTGLASLDDVALGGEEAEEF